MPNDDPWDSYRHPSAPAFRCARRQISAWIKGLTQVERDTLSTHSVTALREAMAYAIEDGTTPRDPPSVPQGEADCQVRVPAEDAKTAIESFLWMHFFGEEGTPTIVEDGKDGWAFYLDDEDTTSYCNWGGVGDPEIAIEWCGTQWNPSDQDQAAPPEGKGDR